jgi:hypothetical protein
MPMCIKTRDIRIEALWLVLVLLSSNDMVIWIYINYKEAN